jgi:hypothetical protein
MAGNLSRTPSSHVLSPRPRNCRDWRLLAVIRRRDVKIRPAGSKHPRAAAEISGFAEELPPPFVSPECGAGRLPAHEAVR